MIISASRRTDIPAFFSDWFFDGVKSGKFVTPKGKTYNIPKDKIDGIVFWTKNAAPMLPRLGEISNIPYYFQYTLTPYGSEVEPNVPKKLSHGVDTIMRLVDLVGPYRVIWRYDPIMITDKYTLEYHEEAISLLAEKLYCYVKSCVVSFIDVHYRNVGRRLAYAGLYTKPLYNKDKEAILITVKKSLAGQMKVFTCAENLSPLSEEATANVEPSKCIDGDFLNYLGNKSLPHIKDKSQRLLCGCHSSIDIGEYNTCNNGCVYCYANI